MWSVGVRDSIKVCLRLPVIRAAEKGRGEKEVMKGSSGSIRLGFVIAGRLCERSGYYTSYEG